MVKDYDCTINYHPEKANVVADALRKDLGCVLMQYGKVVAYASRQLKDHK